MERKDIEKMLDQLTSDQLDLFLAYLQGIVDSERHCPTEQEKDRQE